MLSGDGAGALRDLAAEKGVLVSESFQRKFGKNTGETIRLATPSGTAQFKIAGVYVDYSSDSGSVLIERNLYKRFWKDDLGDAFDLWLARGAPPGGGPAQNNPAATA